MRTDAARARCRPRPSLRVAAVALTTCLAGCVYVVSGDEEMIDEFAQFKARGGECLPRQSGDGADGEGPLSEADRYRWLLYRGLLGEVVAPSGFVRYGELNDDAELLEAARLTVRQIADIDATRLGSGADKLAFWVNAYNALTLDAAARALAEDPAFRVDANNFAFFDQEVHVVGGHVLSLNHIENGVIRGDEFHPSVLGLDDDDKALLLSLHDDLWAGAAPDPRFHFVINCASRSCPSLLGAPLGGDSLESVLEAATQAFLDDDERGAGPDGISQIFAFYFADFEAAGGVDAFIGRYRDLDEVNSARFLAYDWALNDEGP